MKVSRVALAVAVAGLGVAPALFAVVPQAGAAGPAAKARCRVGALPRVQIAVGANGLAPGTAQFQVTAGANASSVLTNAVDALGDAAAEWDSAIAVGDAVEGTRGTIDANFAAKDQTVSATVSQGDVVVATASAKCGAK